ncbi:ATP-binding protein [Metabacillus fastidiosus]|uniref:ATP-binding protein n=1 Tax=Metabacillus fastidiosus TaxID=1458 RepID=UPI003D2AC555
MNKNTSYPPDYSSVPQDNLILEHYGINELNFESVKNYRSKFLESKPDHPWNGLEMKEFLYKIGAWGKVRNTNKEGLTLAGLLMFSEERVITEVLPQYFLEYRESLEEVEYENWSERFTSQDGTWSGNVFDFYFKTSADLNRNINEDAKRSGLLYEVLINTLVHADYEGEGGIVIEKEKNLFRFSNPGLFRISVEQALEGNISNLRNPNLFKMFLLLGLCKRTGSGLKEIDTTWKEYGELNITQLAESERSILTLYVKLCPFDKDTQMEEEKSVMENFGDFEDSVNSADNSCNNEINSVNKDLDLYNNEENSYNNGDNSMNKEFYSDNIEVNSMNNNDNSYNKEKGYQVEFSNSDNKEMESIGNGVVNREINYSEKDEQDIDISVPSAENVEKELWEISELARRKKRLSPSVMEEIILRLCARKTLMLRELADLLERTPDGLRNNYLAKLLDKGQIRLKYPDQINHPRQAYIFVGKEQN